MAFAKPSTELLQWGLTLLLPFLVAVLLPGTGASRRTGRWLIAAQLVGLALTLIGLILPMAANGDVLIKPGVAMLVFATGRRWGGGWNGEPTELAERVPNNKSISTKKGQPWA
ncbi:MAG: hypothetical protein NTW83_14250 [Cyanobacteria bacterium]|nr:hypothetical protein [Cyanobacteriota bacterium]